MRAIKLNMYIRAPFIQKGSKQFIKITRPNYLNHGTFILYSCFDWGKYELY